MKRKSVICGWFYDTKTGKFCNDVYLELPFDDIEKEQIDFLLSKKNIDIKLTKEISSLISVIKIRKVAQSLRLGLFDVPADWTRKDVELTIRYLGEEKLREAERCFYKLLQGT